MGVEVLVGRTNCPLCPVAAVLSYLVSIKLGPLFILQNGKPLTRARFVAEVREALEQSGVDSKHYSGHSFRSGAVTTAAKKGVGEVTIQMLRTWRSDAYRVYIKTPRTELADISKLLAQ